MKMHRGKYSGKFLVMGGHMKIKFCSIILFFLSYYVLQASDFQPHSSTVNLDDQLLNHAKLREDRWKFLMLNSVRDLDDSNLGRKTFHDLRVTGRKICEDAPDCQDIKALLDEFDSYHRYGQYVSKSAINARRIALKQIYNKRIDKENLKNQELLSGRSVIFGSAPMLVAAQLVGGDNNSSVK